MQINGEQTCDHSQSSAREGTEDLKKTITFSNSQLHKLITNQQKFSERIKELNRKAVKEITNESYEEAIVYVAEAERNLEYAASCGMSIDRTLIITTLKNLACVYQRLWELSPCYDYIEALIFNLSVQGDDPQKLLKSQTLKDRASPDYQKLSKLANIKLKLAVTYLQFSALSSQLGKHKQANKIVNNSLNEFKTLADICHDYELLTRSKTSVLLESIRDNVEIKTDSSITAKLLEAKATLQQLKQHAYFFSFDCTVIEKLAMGDIMQVKCTTVEEATEVDGMAWLTSQLGLTYLSIYISCCYFALATEIRLAIPQAERDYPEHSSQLQTAKLYHLHSIIMASQFVLVESNYLTHIIRSFKNNFQIDIIEDDIPKQHDQPSTSRFNHDNRDSTAEAELENCLHQQKSDEGIQVDLGPLKSYGKLQLNHTPSRKKLSVRKHSISQKIKSPRNKLTKIVHNQHCNKNDKKKTKQVSANHSNSSKQLKKKQPTQLRQSLERSNKLQSEYLLTKTSPLIPLKTHPNPPSLLGCLSKTDNKPQRSTSKTSRLKLKKKLNKSPY